MAKKFDFAFVLAKNLGLPHFPVSQAMATFTVTGDEDPLTLQQMRDAVHPQFVATQKKVNDFIQSRNGQIARLGFNDRLRKQDGRLIDEGNKTIQRFLDDFKKAADGELETFERKQAEKARKIAESPGTVATGVKWAISVAWTLYQGTKGAMDALGAEGPLKIYDGIKSFIDALKDLMELLGKAQDQFASEKAVNGRVRAALKAMAGKKTFTESDVKALEELVQLYETKVLGMEMTAKSLSSKLTLAISRVPEKGIAPEAQRDAESKLDGLLKALTALGKKLQPVEKKLKLYKLNLGAAKAYAKKEKAQSWIAWTASKSYDFKDAGWAAWEKDFADVADDLTDKVVDYLIKKFSNPENVVRAG